MTSLNKLALATAIAAISAGAQAELKALDDSAMGELTGQAGLTIDIETKWTIGEFAYKDGGSVLFQNISMGGGDLSALSGGMLDNIRLNLDVAGGGAVGEDLHYGLSEITELAGVLEARGNTTNPGITQLAAGTLGNVAGYADLNTKKNFGDGDLVIHIDATDHLNTGGGMEAFVAGTGESLALAKANKWAIAIALPQVAGTLTLQNLDLSTAAELVHTAVDFKLSIDAIKIASSDYVIGSGAGTGTDAFGTTSGLSTTLISDLSIQGFLGPTDIQIENHGNGFSDVPLAADVTAAEATNAAAQATYDAAIVGLDPVADAAAIATADADLAAALVYVPEKVGVADSKIHWDSYVDVTDLDVYIDIAGVQVSDMKINNTRGDTTNIEGLESFGFAHSERTIYAVKDTVLSIDSAQSLNGGTNVADYVDGIAINTEFKGDMEIGALSFGDSGDSIGELYWTDIRSTTNWVVSAH